MEYTYSPIASFFDYPKDGNIPKTARETAKPLSARFPEAAESMRQFASEVSALPSHRLEELYSGTFDLNPACCPYVGYLLFGETYKRGAFMAKLREAYKAIPMNEENECPDQIRTVLRYSEQTQDTALVQELRDLCLIPAVEKMDTLFASGGAGRDNPYQHLVRSLKTLLASCGRETPIPEEVMT